MDPDNPVDPIAPATKAPKSVDFTSEEFAGFRSPERRMQAEHERSIQKWVIYGTLGLFAVAYLGYCLLAFIDSGSADLLELIKWSAPFFAAYWGYYLGTYAPRQGS